jgi:hypothetical protein
VAGAHASQRVSIPASGSLASWRRRQRAKEGNSVRYEIADDTVFTFCEQVCGVLREQLTELDTILSGGAA